MPACVVRRSHSLKAAIAKAKARLEYVQAQLTRTARWRAEILRSQQALDQAENDAATARADVAEAQANYDAAVAGPTREERAIADAQVKAAAAALAVLERRLDKTTLRAPADGMVSVIVAEVGENVRAGQPILMIEATGKQWLSFNAREDHLHGLAVGKTVEVARPGLRDPKALSPSCGRSGRSRPGRPSGLSAITTAIRCACASIREAMPAAFEPGMTVWLNR